MSATNPFRAIPAAMEAVHRSPAVVIAGSLISFGAGMVSQCSGRFGGGIGDLAGQTDHIDPKVLMALGTAMMAGAGVSCCVGLAVSIFQIWLAAGMTRVQAEVLEGKEGQFPTLFSGGDVFGPLVLASLLVGMINGGCFVISAAPAFPFFYKAVVVVMAGDILTFYYWLLGGLVVLAVLTIPISTYVWAGVRYTPYAVIIDRLGVMEALEKAWELSKGRKLSIVNFGFCAGIFAFLGVFACFVGAIYTGAIATTAWTESYLRLTGRLGGEDEAISPG